jgi:hypothetical protein
MSRVVHRILMEPPPVAVSGHVIWLRDDARHGVERFDAAVREVFAEL